MAHNPRAQNGGMFVSKALGLHHDTRYVSERPSVPVGSVIESPDHLSLPSET